MVQLSQRMKQTRYMGNSMFSDHSVAGGRTRRSCNCRAAAAHAGNQTGGFGTASHSSIRVIFFFCCCCFYRLANAVASVTVTCEERPSGSHKWAEVWAVGRPRRSLYCLVLEIVCRSPGSARAAVVFPVDGVKSQIKTETGRRRKRKRRYRHQRCGSVNKTISMAILCPLYSQQVLPIRR